MKKLLALCLCIACLFLCACQASTLSKPGTKYVLVGQTMDNKGYMDQAAIREYSGGETYYIIIYEDNTVELKLQKGDPVQMLTDGEKLWRAEDPETYAVYTLEGDTLTVQDYPFTYYFEK